MDGPIRMDCLPPHRAAAVTSRNWPKATINVAWATPQEIEAIAHVWLKAKLTYGMVSHV